MENPMSDILSQMELVNGCKVIDKSYIESEQMFILKLEGQKLITRGWCIKFATGLNIMNLRFRL